MVDVEVQALTEYEAVIQEAEGEASTGRYKEAYNTLGRALWLGGPDDRECRWRRGTYAYQVGHSRLDRVDGPDGPPAPKETLIKAGCWLARAEAYLLSASEDATADVRSDIEQDLQQTKGEQERFRQLCHELGSELFFPGNGASR